MGPSPADAQDLDPKLWVPNGTVYATTSFKDTIYIGGAFTEVGKATGGAAAVDPTTGSVITQFPTVLGQVHVVISDGAGGYYIGGQFTHVGGQPRENVARINADNSVNAWNPGALNEVYALYPSPNGGVYMGGSFTQVGGQPRSRIAEVLADGTVTAFAPALNGTVRAITMFNGAVIAGGDFTMVGVTPRNRLVMLTTGGGLFTWNPGSFGPVHAMKVVTYFVPGPGNVTSLLVGGSFSIIGGFSRNNAAMLDFVTGQATSWNPNVNGPVYALAQTANGFYLGGNFTTVGGSPRTNVALVDDQAGTVNATWAPAVNGEVKALLVRASTVVLGGRFSSAGGQSRRALAALNSAGAGTATTWDPHPSHDVEALLDGGSRIVAGGIFTAANMVTRNRIASLLKSTGAPTSWNPNADNEVRALALQVVNGSVQAVFAGGYFNNIGGAARTKLAAIHPTTSAATTWNPVVAGGGASVRTFCFTGGTLYVGGDFTTLNGIGRSAAGAFQFPGGTLMPWNPNVGGPGALVLAMTATNDKIFLGGAFPTVGGQARSNLACVDRAFGALLPWNAGTNDYVFDVQLGFGRLYAGGFFQTANGQPRLGAAAFDTTGGVLDPWNPDLDGSVYAINFTEGRVVLGGNFDTSHGFARPGVVRVDGFVGSPDATDFGTPGSVIALDITGFRWVVAGSFPGVHGHARPNLGVFDEIYLGACAPGPLVSPAGAGPRSIAPGDFDGDGITDLVVTHLDPIFGASVSLLRGSGTAGVGDGTFTVLNPGILFGGDAFQAVAADFDVDGYDDVAVAMRDNNMGTSSGSVFVNRNLGGGNFDLNGWIEITLLGHAEGLAVGDVTNDGILDIAVCLRDSAGIDGRGGIQLLRGTGANGVWNGGFTTAWKAPTSFPSRARRVILQDFNADGSLDMAYSGGAPGEIRALRILPGGAPSILEGISVSSTIQESGFGIASGDINGDGRADLVVAGQGQVRQVFRSANDNPSSGPGWFTNTASDATPLSSTPREIALYDYDFDGKLDLVCAMDSTSRIEVHHGFGDGTFDAALNVVYPDVHGMVIADVATNGSADIVVSQPQCDQVFTFPQTQTSPLVLDLDVTAPNGGEVWAQLPFAEGTSAPSMAATPSAEIADSPEPPIVASTQLITWTKGNGIAAVDVDVSRDGGDSWQSIGRNQPGTSLRWIVTPPASATALVRVRDSNVRTRADVSDAWFDIPATTVSVDPLPSVPRVAGIRMAGAHPVADGDRVAFLLDVPRAADVRVDVYDAAGRHVRTVARGTYEAGTHPLVWELGPRAGVYFARAIVGEAKLVEKFVVLR
jgi:hypothetical protein